MILKHLLSTWGRWGEGAAETAADHSLVLWGWLTLVMILFTLAAWPIGVAWVSFDGSLADLPPVLASTETGAAVDIGPKEVGYFAALNWSFYGAALLPVMVVMMLQIWAAMPRTLRDLSAAGMIRDAAFAPLSPAEVERRWDRVRSQGALFFLVIFIAVFVVALSDWWEVVGRPLLFPQTLADIPLNHPSLEFDWSISSHYSSSSAATGVLLIYGLAAYVILPAVSTGLIFSTMICGLYYVGFLCGRIGPVRDRLSLVAVPADAGDKLGGFGRFSTFFSLFVGLAILVVVGCLLMIIQNAYLRDPASRNVIEFLALDIRTLHQTLGETTLLNLGEGKSLWAWLFQPTKVVLENPQTAIGTFLLALTSMVSLAASWLFLGQAARSARRRSLEHLPALAREHRTTTGKMRPRLEAMEFWPVGWLKINQLLVLLASFAMAILSYRLLAAPVALATAHLAKAFWDAFRQRRAA